MSSKTDLNLASDLIQTIISNFTIKEISLLSIVNSQFNTICNKESLWRNVVLNEYGMKKKCGKTWREMAKNLVQECIMSLHETWVNGETYGQILNKSLKRANMLKYIKEIKETAIKVFSDQYKLNKLNNIPYTNAKIIRELDAVYDERLDIIMLSLVALSTSKPVEQIGSEIFAGYVPVLNVTDSTIYIIQYCMLSRRELIDAIETYWARLNIL